MFAALASIASISILLHSIHVSFFGWFLMRFISGMCFVGMYTVAESWINDLSENNNRGKALSIYMMVSMAGSSRSVISKYSKPRNCIFVYARFNSNFHFSRTNINCCK